VSELFNADRQTDKLADRHEKKKLIVAFRNFAKAYKNLQGGCMSHSFSEIAHIATSCVVW